MPSSLSKLIETLPQDEFSILDNFYCGYSQEQRELLKQKGNFPYSFVNSFEKLTDHELPKLRHWKNSLMGNSIDITSTELDHLNKIFEELNCDSLKHFFELYLTVDVLQLACWFEELRSVCYETYELNCAQFYTASNLSGAASLKVCKPELEVLTDRSLLDMTERMIRGGIASVYSSRLETANSPLLPNFDASKEMASIVYIDTNNLYGGIMLKHPLPLRAFELITGITLEDIINADDEGDIVCVYEVDLEYPDELHEKHLDFPLISDKQPIDPLELSEYQTEMINVLKITTAKTEKLRQTFRPKKHYVVHYRNLKFFAEQGMKVTNIHYAIKFQQ